MFPDTHLQASKPGHRGEALGKETCTIKTWLLLVCTSHNLLIPKVSAAQTPPPGDSRVPPEDPAQPECHQQQHLSAPHHSSAQAMQRWPAVFLQCQGHCAGCRANTVDIHLALILTGNLVWEARCGSWRSACSA